MSDSVSRCGHVAIIGRPNVGKSTLVNHLIGVKLSITSRKPQTTRDRILGVATKGSTQLVFLDTPGIGIRGQGRQIERYMQKQALGALDGVDVVVFLTDATSWTPRDEAVLKHVAAHDIPVVCAMNKIDRIANKNELLPSLQTMSERYAFDAIVPISALKSQGLDDLCAELERKVPEAPWIFAKDEYTDRSARFLVSELVREQLVRQLGDELPHRTAVTIESWEEDKKRTEIDAVICVEREGQKGIVLGSGGQRLKAIGSESRTAIERLLQTHVRLNLWVSVRRGWTNNHDDMTTLGYR